MGYTLNTYSKITLYDSNTLYREREYLIDIQYEGNYMDAITDELIDKIYNITHPIYIELYLSNGNLYAIENGWYSFINKLPKSVLKGED
jgi:hypothetical protein